MKSIVLAYSGGLDTSVILAWLKETYKVPVFAYIANVGQNEDVGEIRERALATGAADALVDDLVEEFASEYVFTAVKANAIYEGYYLMGTALARPVIAKNLVKAAEKLGSDAVSHGSTGKGNDQVRFELSIKSLNPSLKIIAPWREWAFNSRKELIDYAKSHGIKVPVTIDKPYSMDANIAHISYEGGILENPYSEPPEEIFQLTKSPQNAPVEPEYVEITFEGGSATEVNGTKMTPAKLLSCLNTLGGKHGVGRIDIVENRYIGIKSRGVYESPGVTLLMHAHRAVESITLDREVSHFKDSLVTRFAEMIYNGYWFSPEGELLRNTIELTQKNVTGTARLKLYKGACQIVGRKSPLSLYNPEQSSFDSAMTIKSDATGFINTNAQRLIAARRQDRK